MKETNAYIHENAYAVADDVLHGADEIAMFLGLSRRSIYYFTERGELPVFRLGNKICARRSTLVRHLERLESASVDAEQTMLITDLNLGGRGRFHAG